MPRRPPLQRQGARLLLAALAIPVLASAPAAQSWCSQPPRAGYERLDRIPAADDWFQVFRIDPGVFAIYEPFNFQEVISYLVVGSREALLFDTGMGMGRISAVVRALTALPVTVLNSHTHFDHTGGNAEFDSILVMAGDYARRSAAGSTHAQVAAEVSPGAFCGAHLSSPFDTAAYRVRPFTPTRTVGDGAVIDLGGRQLEVLHIPGHAPDAVALLDRSAGLLWTGDTFYDGPIWLHSPGTDLDAYRASLDRLAALAPTLRQLLPGHNFPVAPPARLVALRDAFVRVRSGAVAPVRTGEGRAEYRVDGFDFVLPAPAAPQVRRQRTKEERWATP